MYDISTNMHYESKIPIKDRYFASIAMVLQQITGQKIFNTFFAAFFQRRLRRLQNHLELSESSERQFVERREGLTSEQFRNEYFLRSRPVIFSGAAKNWACCKTWNLDHFDSAYGHEDLL